MERCIQWDLVVQDLEVAKRSAERHLAELSLALAHARLQAVRESWQTLPGLERSLTGLPTAVTLSPSVRRVMEAHTRYGSSRTTVAKGSTKARKPA